MPKRKSWINRTLKRQKKKKKPTQITDEDNAQKRLHPPLISFHSESKHSEIKRS